LKYHIGQKATFEKKIKKEDVIDFSRITGDHNPIHINEKYAENSIFKKPIAHGILCSGLISALIANKLPGEGTIYLGQELKFLEPVFYNDILIAKVEIEDIIIEKKHILLSTVVMKKNNQIVIEGKARVKVKEV